mmetsp:Transcript_2444/g.8656  ORF Transcript_2444/g.8656 Transcript_2444/m.8656 type:complete len:202 (-) Transcript_2444:1390-1995(-)
MPALPPCHSPRCRASSTLSRPTSRCFLCRSRRPWSRRPHQRTTPRRRGSTPAHTRNRSNLHHCRSCSMMSRPTCEHCATQRTPPQGTRPAQTTMSPPPSPTTRSTRSHPTGRPRQRCLRTARPWTAPGPASIRRPGCHSKHSARYQALATPRCCPTSPSAWCRSHRPQIRKHLPRAAPCQRYSTPAHALGIVRNPPDRSRS